MMANYSAALLTLLGLISMLVGRTTYRANETRWNAPPPAAAAENMPAGPIVHIAADRALHPTHHHVLVRTAMHHCLLQTRRCFESQALLATTI